MREVQLANYPTYSALYVCMNTCGTLFTICLQTQNFVERRKFCTNILWDICIGIHTMCIILSQVYYTKCR